MRPALDAAAVTAPRRRGPLSEVRAAVGLLTRIPVGVSGEAAGASAFPLVGAAIGIVGMAPLLVAGRRVAAARPRSSRWRRRRSLTGAIHLDAVADTADALMARDRAAAEQARRDPRLGTGGVARARLRGGVRGGRAGGGCRGLGSAAAWVVGVVGVRGVAGGAGGRRRSGARPGRRPTGSGAWFVGQVDALGRRCRGGSRRWSSSGWPGPHSAVRALGRARRGGLPGSSPGLLVVRLRGQLDGDALGAATELALRDRPRRGRGAGRVSRFLALVLGGTRSGKSAHGLALTRQLAGDGRAWFLATARPGDPELDERIARHRRQRPADWPTIEVGTDLAGAIAETEPAEPVLRRRPDALAQPARRRRAGGPRSDPRRPARRCPRRDRAAARAGRRRQRRDRPGAGADACRRALVPRPRRACPSADRGRRPTWSTSSSPGSRCG